MSQSNMILTNENYYSKEANMEYMSVSQYHDFVGVTAIPGCEAMAMAKLQGRWVEDKSVAQLVGGYVDAYFEGTIDEYKIQNPEIFNKNGSLSAKFIQADSIIERVNRDDLFRQYMSGEKQVIVTGEIGGVMWKGKIDSLHDSCIVDLKVMANIYEPIWVDNVGRLIYIDAYSYDDQAAVYQELIRQKTGKRLPFFHAAVTKEKYPDLEVIHIPDDIIDMAMQRILSRIDKVNFVKSGQVKPVRCGSCDYCKSTKKLTTTTNYYNLRSKVLVNYEGTE